MQIEVYKIIADLYKEDDNPQGRNEGNIRTYISRIKKKTNGALTNTNLK